MQFNFIAIYSPRSHIARNHCEHRQESLEDLVALSSHALGEPGALGADDAGARALVFSEFTRVARAHGAVNLAQGIPEPLFDTLIEESLQRLAAEAGWSYAEPSGIPSLRVVVASGYGMAGRAPDVLVTSGATESVLLALRSLGARFGQRVLAFEPFYPYYPGFAGMAGLAFEPLPMQRGGAGFRADWERLEQLARGGTRIVLLNTPHNPTGWCMDEPDLRILVDLATRHQLAIVVDHAYRGFTYGAADLCAELAHTLPGSVWIAGTASKCLSAPGLRVGWLLCPPEAHPRALEQHLHLTYCQPPALQSVVAHLLEVTRPQGKEVNIRYRQKRDALHAALIAAGLDASLPAGGHFIVGDYGAHASLPPREYAVEFTRRYGVTPLPVDPFYLADRPTELRFSFSAPPDDVQLACERMRHPEIQCEASACK